MMKKVKEKIGKILVILLACLSVGTVACAAGSTATEVQIAIEGAQQTTADQSGKNTKVTSVQTGDTVSLTPYLLAVAASVGLGGVCLSRKKKKGLIAAVALFLSLLCMNNTAFAAEGVENVNITIPSSISVSFEANGENSISEFGINNQSLVPITMEKVNVTECNDWKLCESGETIAANTKQMVFVIEGQCLMAEENKVHIAVEENSSKACEIQIDRGAWTTSDVAETALQLEFEYALGQKEFQLNFDPNGSSQTIEPKRVCNGDTVTLPSVERDKYEFVGWEDSEGNLYTEQFVMPIGDVTLTAKWKETVAYAIFIADDCSLRFVRSAEPITVGSTYDEKTVTGVYTGFETDTYSSEMQVPWYDENYYCKNIITKVVVEDVIQPVSTAHWFHWMYDCESMDLQKLDTSKVTNMAYMFAWTGFNSKNFEVKGVNEFDVSNVTNMVHTFGAMGRDSDKLILDLSKWDVSKVTNMAYMFDGMGYFSTTFSLGDLSKWDVSNVTDMTYMFRQTGYHANWYVDCSDWNVRKVTSYNRFNLEVSSKVIAPSWVY